MGVFHPAGNAIDTMRQVLEALSKHDPTFAERFAALPKHGRTRCYLAMDPNELYPGRPDLVRDSSIELSPVPPGSQERQLFNGPRCWPAAPVANRSADRFQSEMAARHI